MHVFGEPGIGVALTVWARNEGAPKFALCLEGEESCSYVYAETLPDVWDLLARWTPVVRDDGITRVVAQATDPERGASGLIETIARRATWGAQQPYEALSRRRPS